MRNESKQQIISNYLFVIPYILFICQQGVSNTTFSKFIHLYGWPLYLILIISILCVLLKNFFDNTFSAISIFCLLIFSFSFILSYRNSNSINIIMLLILFWLSNKINLETVVKCHFYTYLTITLLAMACSFVGIIDNYTVFSTTRGILRYSLGNTYPTDFSAGVMYLILDFCYLNRRSWRYRYTLTIILISIFVVAFTKAYTSFIFAILIAIIMLFSNTSKKASDVLKYVNFLSFIVLPIISVNISAKYFQNRSSLLFLINRLLDNRLIYGNLAINRYGVTLFGNHVDMVGAGWGTNTNLLNTYSYIDNGYLQLLLINGILVCGIICFCFAIFSLNVKSNTLSWILLVIAISSIVEPRFFYVQYDPFIIGIAILIYNYKSKGESAF